MVSIATRHSTCGTKRRDRRLRPRGRGLRLISFSTSRSNVQKSRCSDPPRRPFDVPSMFLRCSPFQRCQFAVRLPSACVSLARRPSALARYRELVRANGGLGKRHCLKENHDAKKRGVPVASVTIWVITSISRSTRDPPRQSAGVHFSCGDQSALVSPIPSHSFSTRANRRPRRRVLT